MGGLSFIVEGSMCCPVHGKGGRIDPDASLSEALRKALVSPMEMGARTMKGFVRIDPECYRTDAALTKWTMRGVKAAAARAATQGVER